MFELLPLRAIFFVTGFIYLFTVGIRSEKMPLALFILAAVVLSAALNLIPIVIGAVIGGLAMILSGCLTNEEAYEIKMNKCFIWICVNPCNPWFFIRVPVCCFCGICVP